MTYLFGIIIALNAALAAELRLYLVPKVFFTGASLSISDLAVVQGEAPDVGRVGGIRIPPSAAEDGYIDRKEITEILVSNGETNIQVFGSGVRIMPVAAQNGGGVRRGADIRFRIVRGRVTVERSATAVEAGAIGQTVKVKVPGGVASGTVVDDRTVEMTLPCVRTGQ